MCAETFERMAKGKRTTHTQYKENTRQEKGKYTAQAQALEGKHTISQNNDTLARWSQFLNMGFSTLTKNEKRNSLAKRAKGDTYNTPQAKIISSSLLLWTFSTSTQKKTTQHEIPGFALQLVVQGTKGVD